MIVKVDNSIPGYFRYTQIMATMPYVSTVPNGGSILELGSFFGKLTVQIGLNKHDSVKLHTIDRWGSINLSNLNQLKNFMINQSEFDAVYNLDNKVISKVDDNGILSGDEFYNCWKMFTKTITNATHLRSDIDNVDTSDDSEYDLIIQDASHDYKGVWTELEKFWPLLKKGGTWIADDYHDHWPEVKQALNDWTANTQYDNINYLKPDGMILIKK
jgi:hypothetical protein